MANLSLEALLAETIRLRARIESRDPNSARLSVLIRDEQRLRRAIGGAA